eukprot:6171989-Pleurochrysis_carterae.AAC.2
MEGHLNRTGDPSRMGQRSLPEPSPRCGAQSPSSSRSLNWCVAVRRRTSGPPHWREVRRSAPWGTHAGPAFQANRAWMKGYSTTNCQAAERLVAKHAKAHASWRKFRAIPALAVLSCYFFMRPACCGQCRNVTRLFRSAHAREIQQLHAAVVSMCKIGAPCVQVRLLPGEADKRVIKKLKLGP